MHMATTFNEANIQLLVQIMPAIAQYLPAAKAAIAAAAQGDGFAEVLDRRLCRSG